MNTKSYVCLYLFAASISYAADWNETEVSLLKGNRFHDVGNGTNITKTIVTLQNASGYKYGRNFFFVDAIKSNDQDNDYGEVYGEFYSSLSYSKIKEVDWSERAIKEISLTGGVNYGAKNSAFGPNPQVVLVGPTVDFNLPGFKFFHISVLAYNDNSRYSGFDGGYSCGKSATTYQVTPTWNLPFSLGRHKFSFEGFLDLIGKHGTCSTQILTQPQLRLDVGNYFGKSDTVFMGIEYQYWKNKFGVEDHVDNFPQALLTWKL